MSSACRVAKHVLHKLYPPGDAAAASSGQAGRFKGLLQVPLSPGCYALVSEEEFHMPLLECAAMITAAVTGADNHDDSSSSSMSVRVCAAALRTCGCVLAAAAMRTRAYACPRCCASAAGAVVGHSASGTPAAWGRAVAGCQVGCWPAYTSASACMHARPRCCAGSHSWLSAPPMHTLSSRLLLHTLQGLSRVLQRGQRVPAAAATADDAAALAVLRAGCAAVDAGLAAVQHGRRG